MLLDPPVERKLVESQAAERNRLLKLLETANIKLASVASDVFGVSGRAMLRALIARMRSARLRRNWPLAKSAIASAEASPSAVAQQLAQLPQRPGRHEALGDQAVPHQIGDPLGILHVGLAPRHVADVPGVADDQLEMPLQDGIDRAPVDARALHPNVRHSRCPQPVPQRFEVPRHGAKRPHLLVRLRPGAPTRRHATTVS